MKSQGAVRPMAVADVAATGRLFLKIFRHRDVAAPPDLCAYLGELAFGAPAYSPTSGSFVHAEADGAIRSALIAVPMRFVANDRIVPARLLCAYMTDAVRQSAGAAALALTVRARHQDLAFSDSASPTSRDHVKAMGGVVLALQNLEWTRVLRPVAALAGRLETRLRRRVGLGLVARPIDAILRALLGRIVPPTTDLTLSDMPRDLFLAAAPGLIAHYAVRPLWPRDELAWLLDRAALNTTFGPLRLRALHDRAGGLVGCFLFYGAPGRPAHVLNVLARKGTERQVVAALMHDLDQAGCTAVIGRAQPALMEGLAAQRLLRFHHKAFVCLTTRHADIVLAAERGDIYLGGLAGESWSRLMTDF